MPHAGHAVAHRVQPARRIRPKRVRRCKHLGRRADAGHGDARTNRARANRAGLLIATTGDDGHAGGQPEVGRDAGVDAAGHLRPLVHAGEHVRIEIQRVHDLHRPCPRAGIEEPRAGRVAGIRRELARQHQAQVILRQEEMVQPFVGDRPVAPQPQQFRRRESCERSTAGDLDQPLATDDALDLIRLSRGALIVPKDRRPDHLALRVEQDRAVHLSRKADRDHRPKRDLRTDTDDRRATCLPPVVGALLRPARLRRDGLVRHGRPRAHDAVHIERDGLQRRRADVDAEEMLTRRHADAASSRSSCPRPIGPRFSAVV